MKKTPNQIREELRRQMAAHHANELDILRKEKTDILKRYQDTCNKNQQLRHENDELKETVRQYEDWNRRLMEFMDMSDEDRNAELEEMKIRLANEAKLKTFTDLYCKLFSLMF